MCREVFACAPTRGALVGAAGDWARWRLLGDGRKSGDFRYGFDVRLEEAFEEQPHLAHFAGVVDVFHGGDMDDQGAAVVFLGKFGD